MKILRLNRILISSFGALLLMAGCGGSSDFSKPAVHSFRANPPRVEMGEEARVTAEFSGGTGWIEPDIGSVPSGAHILVHPDSTTVYTLKVTDPAGQTLEQSFELKVNPGLDIRIEGYEGHGGRVRVEGPRGYLKEMTTSGCLRNLEPGSYGIIAESEMSEQGALHPWIPEQVAEVTTGTRVQVLYPAPSYAMSLGPGVNLEMVLVPAGTFWMGSRDSDLPADTLHYPSESPLHLVTLRQAFYMARVPTTQGQWGTVSRENPSLGPQDPLHPVNNVSYLDIEGTFLPCLNERFPKSGFRLPSEAEWEYACRAGTTTPCFFEDEPPDAFAWPFATGEANQHRVGLKLPNPWGLQDLFGLVAQWCMDAFHDGYEGAPSNGSAWPGIGDMRIIRGSDPVCLRKEARSAKRGCFPEWSKDPYLGFRIVGTEPKF